ncbi:AsnC family transcriptional regulator [Cystobacter fuscus]|uniref:AsnC family transcriptional regulator n=1 Tax=Cystobacter fuscus TaxID=43 RepID=A0A250JBH6_9BACT|nr:GntR family transcriptional regulator [Cystobacter fuscus]ATB40933.1 AsnC family transcriptional regulator [Cystobacter fuscus]
MRVNERTRDEASEDEALEEQRELLSERIRLALEEEIATGALKPGVALDEQQLATRFGASRTPVREALRQLSVTGLVELRPRRGVVVTPLSPERIMDMFEMTAELEAMCVRLATWRMTPLERSQLQQLHEGSAAMVRAGDLDAYDDFNRRFHETLYRATHNQFMVEQALALRTRMAAFRRTQLRQGDRMTRSRSEHEELMRAIARGDGEEAARCMRAHLLNASSALTHYIHSL